MIVALAKGLGTKWTVLVPLPLARLMPRRTWAPPTNGFTSYGCDNREPGCLTACRCFVITVWNWKWPRGFPASNLESKNTFLWKTLRKFRLEIKWNGLVRQENFWKKGPPLNPDLSGSFSLPIGPVDPKGAVRFGQPDVLPSAFHWCGGLMKVAENG